ncbi:MAG: SusC/RagA family TonB-linked outer membrane protein, partial [Bacteroides sp.]
IYGARAANGVIVITTKKGKMGDKGKITFRAQYGVSNLAYGKWNQMNTTERLDYEEQIGLRVPGTYDRETLERTNINWRDVVYNDKAPMMSYELSTSGGSNKFNYFVSAGYFGQEGIAVGSDFKRYSLRANLEVRPVEWLKIGTNTSLSYENVEEANEGNYNVVTPISAAKFMLPYWDPYAKDGSIASINNNTWKGSNQNPLEWLANNPSERNKAKVLSSLYAELRPIEGLTIRTVGGIDASDNRATGKSNPSYLPNSGSGMVGKSYQRYSNLTWTNTANYIFSIKDDHNLNLLLGQEAVANQSEGFDVTTRGQSNNNLLTMSTATAATDWNDITTESSYLSFFGRAEYNYNNRYYLDFSVRRDGSSKFGKNARWANFWSVGAMWDIKSEQFMEDISWINSAQFIASIGTSGNSSIPAYDHSALFTAGPKYSGMTGIAPYSRGNEDLTWEKLMTTNIGLKLGLFNRANLNIEFYNKKTTDMLMEVPVTFGNGFETKWDNIGVMVNRGVEIDLSVDVIRNKQFTWSISGNASYNHNEITELYNGLDQYEVGTSGLILKVGHPYGEFYAVRNAGVNPANGDALWLTKDGQITNEFNNEDRVLLGKSFVAPWQGGFGTAFSYKGIQLNAQFSWVADRWMMNNDRFFDESNGIYASYNQSSKLLDRWMKPGDVTEIPRDGIPTQLDTHLLEDASFLRLKNLSLSYDLPKSLLKKTKVIERVKIFGQAQNLFTFTKFTGLDPESNMNIYRASYPLSRQFSLGLEVSF